MDLTKESFDGVEDVQTFTLQPSQLAVVIASYDKTIGMTLYICYWYWDQVRILHVSNEQLNNASARDYDVNVCYFNWLIIIAVEKETTNNKQNT